MKPKDDPTIARIRATRHRISQQFDHDPQRLVAHYIELQEKYRHRLGAQPAPEPSVSEPGRSVSATREEPATYARREVDILALLQGED